MNNTLGTIFDAVKTYFEYLKPDTMEQYLMTIGAAFGFVLNIAIGNVDQTVWALIALVISDYTTGVFAACKTGEWDSSAGFIGLAKKATIFFVIAVCHWADAAIKVDILRQMAICAYALNELGSNLENIDKAGYGGAIPAGVRKMLARLRAKADEGVLPLDDKGSHNH